MPKRTGIYISTEFARHQTTFGHPECPERIDAIKEALTQSGILEELQNIDSRTATEDEIAACHDRAYITDVLKTIQSGASELAGGDVSICSESGEVAMLAAGAGLNAVDAVINKEIENAFCAVRPPGHHARPSIPMGFCIFNTVAIVARYAQCKHGLSRVAIVDWDVHHGNGTQEIFYADNSVFFFSTHQSPWYPGTGHREETGEGAGKYFTMNRPFPSGVGGKEIIEVYKNDLLPALEKFKPELILISAGFDSRINDPLGGFQLTDEDFATLTRLLMDFAAKHCGGRIVSMMEGGYSLSGLASAVTAHVTELSKG
ncbi:MAG: histone deacetylase [Chthoniobacterales bacterium]